MSSSSKAGGRNRRHVPATQVVDYAEYCKQVRERLRQEHIADKMTEAQRRERRLEQGRRIAAELPTKRSGDVSIVTWNVAGLRACIKKHFVDIVQSWQDTPEIIALQEIKTSIADVRDALRTLLEGQNYKLICNSGRIPGYSGVAILHKLSFAPIRVALDGALFDRDGYTSLTGTSDLTPEVCREEFWKVRYLRCHPAPTRVHMCVCARLHHCPPTPHADGDAGGTDDNGGVYQLFSNHNLRAQLG
uniref:Apurinic endonuclease-redox protein n=1 Tax=Lygus hesperus TaxID=30085 RepID=A0A146MCJ4_LYGHE